LKLRKKLKKKKLPIKPQLEKARKTPKKLLPRRNDSVIYNIGTILFLI
jgi:hypothetical protein